MQTYKAKLIFKRKMSVIQPHNVMFTWKYLLWMGLRFLWPPRHIPEYSWCLRFQHVDYWSRNLVLDMLLYLNKHRNIKSIA